MKTNEYKCACCNGVFTKGWTDEEAVGEYIENFGTVPLVGDSDDIVCDDCYNEIKKRFPEHFN